MQVVNMAIYTDADNDCNIQDNLSFPDGSPPSINRLLYRKRLQEGPVVPQYVQLIRKREFMRIDGDDE